MYKDDEHYLLVNPVDLSVLSLDLVAHVDGHVAQVADHVRHFAHVALHLVLASVVRYPDSRRISKVWTMQIFIKRSVKMDFSAALGTKSHLVAGVIYKV